jgi:hypothetical protein
LDREPEALHGVVLKAAWASARGSNSMVVGDELDLDEVLAGVQVGELLVQLCTPTLVVANRTQGPDGRWTALDGRDLYRHRLAAHAIYRATYQRQLSRTLGVEWTAADAHGNRELQGLPEDLLRLFSKRSGQIDLEVDRLQADGRERTPRLV